jgi:hypothetical protein
VRLHDPVFGRAEVERWGFTWGEPGDGWAEALVLHTAHSAYRELRPATTPGVVAVLDWRGVLDPATWSTGKVAFAGIGR